MTATSNPVFDTLEKAAKKLGAIRGHDGKGSYGGWIYAAPPVGTSNGGRRARPIAQGWFRYGLKMIERGLIRRVYFGTRTSFEVVLAETIELYNLPREAFSRGERK